MPNDSQLNCNYRFCRRESTTKPSDRFLCFYTPAVVTVLSAHVKMSVSKEVGGGCYLLCTVSGVRLYLVYMYLTSGCKIASCLEFISSASRNARRLQRELSNQGEMDGPGERCIQGWGFCCGGEKLVSQQSLLNEVN